MVLDLDPKGDEMFKQEQQFDDTGNMLVNSVQIFQKAKLTLTTVGAVGKIIMNMYDYDTTTKCTIATGTGTAWVKWEFQGKPKFKQLNCTLAWDAANNRTAWLEGSNNDSDWTTIDTYGPTAVDGTFGLLGTDVAYKYIRIRVVHAGASATSSITGVTGST